MNPESDILDRIRKLLRLADTSRGATENEARVALTKARELMTRHNIDSALLQNERKEQGKPGDPIESSKVDLPKTLNPADMLILSLLQTHFNVRCILGRAGSGTPVDIIGTTADVLFAVHAFGFLRETFFRCWNEFKKSVLNPDRTAYYRGLRDGLSAALEEGKSKAEQSYDAGQRQTWAMVMVDNNAAIARYVTERYGRLSTRKSRPRRMDSTSYQAGHAKGQTINVNRPIA